ncbi:hypothetical protein ACOSQ3_004175 [Xanthoceras sorbifolium]
MEEEATSWIRTTKFSHTICYRLDSSRLASIHLSLPERNSWLKSRPAGGAGATAAATSSIEKSVPPVIHRFKEIFSQTSRISLQTVLSDTFKEARSSRKRFSTPRLKIFLA